MPLPNELFEARAFLPSIGVLAARKIAGAFESKTVARAGRIFAGVQGIRRYIDGDDELFNSPNPLLGGITLNQVRDAHRAAENRNYSRGNFFIIEVSTPSAGPAGSSRADEAFAASGAQGSLAQADINLFATDVSYSSATLSGDKRQFGAAVMDNVTGNEATDLTLTTLDSADGAIKSWFRSVARRAANRNDGTFGVPASYALTFTIVHSFVDGFAVPDDEKFYRNVYAMRPVSIQHEMSREAPGLEKIQMTFTQIDTFMGTP